MKTIKIKYVDFWPRLDPKTFIFTRILRERYNVEISDDPDFIFYTPFGKDNLQYLNCVRIFFTGENVSPDFNMCDYAMAFDYCSFGDRYMRLPLYYLYNNLMSKVESRHLWAPAMPKREKFCSFVVSAKGADYRTECFEKLSAYKKVDSGGRYKNNIGEPNGVKDKEAFNREHKFTICFENSSQPGYTTEKLPEAFAAGCIPIYWGDPLVGKVFNEKAFVNVSRYASLEEALEEVKKIDGDDALYEQMLAEPALLHKEDEEAEVMNRLRAFLFSVFDQTPQDAVRRPDGNWRRMHEAIYLSDLEYSNLKATFCMRTLRKIKKIAKALFGKK